MEEADFDWDKQEKKLLDGLDNLQQAQALVPNEKSIQIEIDKVNLLLQTSKPNPKQSTSIKDSSEEIK